MTRVVLIGAPARGRRCSRATRRGGGDSTRLRRRRRRSRRARMPRSFRSSLSEIEAAIARDPKNPALHVALGLLYWDRNDYPKALAAFQHAVKVGPSSAEAHNWLGVALSEKADLPGAIAALRKAVALDPKFGRAYTNLGAALAKSGDFAAAIDIFKQALALEPNSLGARMNLGLALREQGDLDAALEHLRHVVSARSRQRADALRAGTDAPSNRRSRRARSSSFERALELEPEMREGYYALGVALKQQSAAARKAVPPANAAVTRAQEMAARGDFERRRASN